MLPTDQKLEAEEGDFPYIACVLHSTPAWDWWALYGQIAEVVPETFVLFSAEVWFKPGAACAQILR